MGAYLVDHPGTLRQYSARTNWAKSRPTGLTVLHTAESVMDSVGPDTGAEAVADFIRRRSTPGSYHDLCDSDSAIWMVPYEYGAWQDGTGSNGFALSISFACRTTDWKVMSAEKRRGFLRQGAKAFARQQAWLKANGYPTTPLRIVSRAESDRGIAGFIYHGHRDPGRRSDPGMVPPNLFPLAEFIEECRAAMSGDTTQEEEWWEMPIPAEEADRIAQRTRQVLIDGSKDWSLSHIRDIAKATDARVRELEGKLDEVLALLTAQQPPAA